MLTLSEKDFIQAQLNVSIKMKDPKRIISREIALKNIYLDQHGEAFELHKCAQLWAADEWAAGKFFGNKAKLIA